MIAPRTAFRLALLWTLLILIAVLIPGSDLPSVGVNGVDKVAHIVLFAGFGWLWMAALTRPLRTRTSLVLASGLALAVMTEVLQGILPVNRSPEGLDLVADAVGIVLAVLAYRVVSKEPVPDRI